MELSNIWFSGRLQGELWVNFEPTPDQFTVRIAYDGPEGTRYEDRFSLDTDLIRQHTYVSSSTDPENRLKEAVKSLGKIEKAVSRVARHLTPPSETPAQALTDTEMQALLDDRWTGHSRPEN